MFLPNSSVAASAPAVAVLPKRKSLLDIPLLSTWLFPFRGVKALPTAPKLKASIEAPIRRLVQNRLEARIGPEAVLACG